MTARQEKSRPERAHDACLWLARRIGEAVPAGTGSRQDVWNAVETASQRFMDALATWEETGTDDDMKAVRRAADNVVAFWQAAASRAAA